MAITLAIRGDSLDARYSAGRNDGSVFSNAAASLPVVGSGSTGLGSNFLDFTQSGLTTHHAVWDGKGNLGDNVKKSILISASFPTSTGTRAIGGILGPCNIHTWTLGLMILNADVYVVQYNNENTGYLATPYTIPGFSTDTYYDFGLSFDPTLGSNHIKLWVDGVNVATVSSIRTWSSFNSVNVPAFCLGNLRTYSTTNMRVREAVLWDDQIIDFSSVALVGGTGSLDGSARTAYVDADAFEGSVNTFPSGGANDIRAGVSFVQNGVSGTGVLSSTNVYTQLLDAEIAGGPLTAEVY